MNSNSYTMILAEDLRNIAHELRRLALPGCAKRCEEAATFLAAEEVQAPETGNTPTERKPSAEASGKPGTEARHESPLLEGLDAITEGKSKLDLAEEIWRLRKQVEEARLSAALHENAAGQLAQMAVDSVSDGPNCRSQAFFDVARMLEREASKCEDGSAADVQNWPFVLTTMAGRLRAMAETEGHQAKCSECQNWGTPGEHRTLCRRETCPFATGE